MLAVMSRNWWALALRGVLAIIFGIVAFVWPGGTLEALIYVFGAYALIDGILALVNVFTDAGQGRRWALLLEGIIGVLAGIGAFFAPLFAGLALVGIVAFWAIATGVFQIMAAVQLRREIDNEFWLGLAGVLSILFGVLIIVQPLVGALTIVYLIGGYAIVTGVVLLMLAFRLRGAGTGTPGTPTRAAA